MDNKNKIIELGSLYDNPNKCPDCVRNRGKIGSLWKEKSLLLKEIDKLEKTVSIVPALLTTINNLLKLNDADRKVLKRWVRTYIKYEKVKRRKADVQTTDSSHKPGK